MKIGKKCTVGGWIASVGEAVDVSKENNNRGSIVRSGKNRLTAWGSKMKRGTYWM